MRSDGFHVLVTGCGGQLGSELMGLRWPGAFRVTGTTRSELDITDPQQVSAAFDAGGYDLVVNAAAYTAVDRAEAEQDLAFAVNQRGAANIVQACARHEAALIQISTDYVFDGTKPAPYVESDPITALGVYGKSKAAGEAEVRGALRRHLVLRTAWVFGAQGNNFVKTMIKLLEERDELRVVADQQGSPTAARDLASAIIALADRIAGSRMRGADMPWGTYHCTNSGDATWYDIAREIAALAPPRPGRRTRVDPITTAEYPTAAQRPANSRLDCRKIEQSFGIRLRHWRQALEAVVQEIGDPQARPQAPEALS